MYPSYAYKSYDSSNNLFDICFWCTMAKLKIIIFLKSQVYFILGVSLWLAIVYLYIISFLSIPPGLTLARLSFPRRCFKLGRSLLNMNELILWSFLNKCIVQVFNSSSSFDNSDRNSTPDQSSRRCQLTRWHIPILGLQHSRRILHRNRWSIDNGHRLHLKLLGDVRWAQLFHIVLKTSAWASLST